MDRHDVRVIDGGDGPGFPLETFEALGVAGHVRGQHFKGHLTSEPGVCGPIDFAHAAGANRGGDLVVGERLADHRWPDCRRSERPLPYARHGQTPSARRTATS